MTRIWRKLPLVFVRDCDECGCEIGEVNYKRGYVWLASNDEELAELISRAKYYTDPNGPDGEGLSGLKASARATLKQLAAMGHQEAAQ